MATKSVSVSKGIIQLDGSRKESQGSFVLLLQRIAISYDTPCLRCEKRFFQGMVRKVAKVNLLFEVPQTSGIVFETLKSIGLDLNNLLVHLFSILILGHLEVAAGDLGESPARLVLLLRQLVKHLNTLLALIEAKLEVSMPKDLQKGHHIVHFHHVERAYEVLQRQKLLLLLLVVSLLILLIALSTLLLLVSKSSTNL